MNKPTDTPQQGDANSKDSEITDRVLPLAGTDRGGLGDKGWSEVPDDLIGGDPDLEVVPPGMDPVTGAATQDDEDAES